MTNRDESDRSDGRDQEISPAVARAIHALKQPVSVSAAFDDGVMRRVRTDAARDHRSLTAPNWWRLPLILGGHSVSVSRFQPLAVGATLAALAAGLMLIFLRFATAPRELPQVQFVLSAPGAHSVAVLGDFNHWNGTPLKLVRHGSGTWTTTVRLSPGPHVYSFLVDGTRWVADPRAPRSLDDDFGRPSAVVTVPGHST